MNPLYQNDLACLGRYGRLIGIDEAGRGSWAGPVVVAACVLDYGAEIAGLDDSKRLSYDKRARLFERIVAEAVHYRIVEVPSDYIDRHNILQATFYGMQECVAGLGEGHCLIDGNQVPGGFPLSAEAVIKGDSRQACVAAASILAKVHRDRLMERLHQTYPAYRFDRHMGYGTRQHLCALREHGPCPQHRMSYRPLRELCGPDPRTG